MNRVIVIGGNHQNTLAAIRCFGICKCDMHVLLHDTKPLEMLNCAKTKFSLGKTSVVGKSVDEIICWLKENTRPEMQVLFPCSDLAEYAIDSHFNELREHYFIPGFQNDPGMVCELMSKWEQKKFADENGFDMAESQLVSAKNGHFELPENCWFPCIIKPNISAFGVKSDICICKDKDELAFRLDEYGKKGYAEVLLQEYLPETREYGSIGCLSNDKKKCASNITKKIFTLNGNTIYGQFTDDANISAVNKRVLDTLYNIGYRGMYDIEYLVNGNRVYLLEINFRHSGVGFSQVSNNVFAPYLWYLGVCGKKTERHLKTAAPFGKTFLDETVCLRHRKDFGISIMGWFVRFVHASAYAKLNLKDLRGTIETYKKILM